MLLSSSNRKYPSYFSVVVCLRCLLHHILSLMAYTFREFVFITIVQFMMSAILGYVLDCRSYSFVCTVHHFIIIIVQRHWTYKMPVRYILSSVWVRLSPFSPLSIIQYVGLYVFSLPPFLLWWLREYIYFVLLSSSNRKYELLPIV